MIRTSRMPGRSNLVSRPALGAALALAIAAGSVVAAAPAMAAAKEKAPAAPKLKLSKGFQTVAMATSKAIDGAKARPEVVAAQQAVAQATTAAQQARGPARAQAIAARDAAVAALGSTLSAEKAQLDGSFAAVVSPDDKYTAGQLAVSLGSLAQDPLMQRRGLQAMIESGMSAPADLGKFQYFIGSISFDIKDYATARSAMEAAIASGYRENDVEALVAEAYMADNQLAAGLGKLKSAIVNRKASGGTVPESWLRRGLSASYKAKLLPEAGDFSQLLVQNYPTTTNWASAIAIVREVGQFQPQEKIDLMRLMGRTGSYSEALDYREYIEAADPRRLPGETLKVIEAGLASGKLPLDTWIGEARTLAQSRVAADRASLVKAEADARAPAASAAVVVGIADAFLSYDQPAKAADLFTIALGKPGVDTDRALTRLGIAQIDQGKYADGQATLAKVGGQRKSIAQLWSLYAALKAAQPAI